jgi:hypothetical protein
VDGIFAHLLSIAPGAGRVEVGQLETRRDKVLHGMQDGARRYRAQHAISVFNWNMLIIRHYTVLFFAASQCNVFYSTKLHCAAPYYTVLY